MKVATATLCLVSLAAAPTATSQSVAAGANGLQCGVATTQFATNSATATTAAQTGKLSFWWNWNVDPEMDMDGLDPATITILEAGFTPMIWGDAMPPSLTFLDNATALQGYNEPDLYGPACCNCDGKQTYAPATSSGWLPLFNPVTAAPEFQKLMNVLTATPHPGLKVVSPSMANDAAPESGATCAADPSGAGNPSRCQGWMSLFKKAALQLPCTDFNGKKTNCWDIIDSISIHAYAASASDVLAKVDAYQAEFADDFAGTGGRTKKTLWLTEVAAASNDGPTVTGFVKDLMSTSGGLADRTKYGFVERISWFSEFFFPGFNVTGHAIQPMESWSSSLFNPFGGLTPVGTAFFANCAPAAE